MTLTETRSPDRSVDPRTTPPSRTTSGWPLARVAGPLALVAGLLIVFAQLVMLPFDPKDHVPTSQSVVFQSAGVVYLAGFVTLLFALIGMYSWQRSRFGTVAVSVAILGTVLLGGDLWFETFAVPSIADGPAAARVLDSDPSILLGIGAVASYTLFALGWLLVGIAGFRSRAFPRTIGVAIAISGVLGFRALLSPWAIPLAISVAALGVWMMRRSRDDDRRALRSR
jgi:hypothetical protein